MKTKTPHNKGVGMVVMLQLFLLLLYHQQKALEINIMMVMRDEATGKGQYFFCDCFRFSIKTD